MSNRNQSLSAAILSTMVLFTWETAYAQSATEKTPVFGPAESFGAKRQVAISSDAAINVQRATTSGVSGGTTSLQIAPAIDYFVMNNFSIGGFVAVNYVTSGDNDSTRFSIGPRVGYNFGLSDLVSIWPKVGFSYASTSGTVGRAAGDTTVSTSFSNSNLALNIFVPIMFHPVTHFFVGFGPFLDTDLSGDTRTTVWGSRCCVRNAARIGSLTLGLWPASARDGSSGKVQQNELSSREVQHVVTLSRAEGRGTAQLLLPCGSMIRLDRVFAHDAVRDGTSGHSRLNEARLHLKSGNWPPIGGALVVGEHKNA